MKLSLSKSILFCKIVLHSVRVYVQFTRRNLKISRRTSPPKSEPISSLLAETQSPPSLTETLTPQNIVVVGASFAGYHAARLLATSLPPSSAYRLVVIEPSSHFHFTWVLPRFCVVQGHDHKALIPYGPYLLGAEVDWRRDAVVSIEKTHVVCKSGQEITYEFLVLATGSGAGDELPSRVGSGEKEEGMKLLRDVQGRVERAEKIVVVGGGASGVEFATDVKSKYPGKKVSLIHSRDAVLHRFGPELQSMALKDLQRLGVDVFTSERVVDDDLGGGAVKLRSGRELESDCVINCIGQKPNSSLIARLAPSSVSDTGHIRVKPTLQIANDALSNIYICGDVADTGERNPNARSAMRQAVVAADNILLAAEGKVPTHTYKPHWGDAVIKLTLGLDRSVVHFGDGKTELLFETKEKDEALMCDGAWRNLGATPFEDPAHTAADTNKITVSETIVGLNVA